MSAVLLRGGEVDGVATDVLVDGGVVVAVGRGLRPDSAHDVLDADGGAVLPGLHDHHLHLLAMAAARGSVDLGAGAAEGPLRRATGGPGWVRAVNGPADLDRERLDRWTGSTPVRVQDTSGALWVLNSAAVEAVGGALSEDERRTGRLFRSDDRLHGAWPEPDLDLAAVGRDLARRGVTGVTDATPFADAGGPRRLADAVTRGDLPLRVVVTGAYGLPAADGLPRGPVKVVLGDHDLPTLGALTATVERAHDAGRPVAVHCVTAEALALLLAAWAEVGTRPGDRVEHGAVVTDPAATVLAGLGVTVVTQPGFVADRGDRYLAEVEARDHDHLWRCGTLVAAGVPVGGGTDAPHGPADPWRAMAAAVDRRTAAGAVLGAAERVGPERAAALFLTPLEDPGGVPRRVGPGVPADLCVLDRPWADARVDLAAVVVTTTLVSGRVIT